MYKLYLIASLFCIFGIRSSAAQIANGTAPYITVSGSGTVSINRTIVEVRLAIDNNAPSAMQAQQQTNIITNNVLAVLRPYNISNLVTEALSLQPVYNNTDDKKPLLGYESSVAITYSVSPEIAGDTLDAVVQGGANRIDSVQITSRKPEEEEGYKSALSLAMQSATAKANAVVMAANLCLGSLISVKILENGYISPTMVAAETDSATAIVPGNKNIVAEIEVTFKIGCM